MYHTLTTHLWVRLPKQLPKALCAGHHLVLARNLTLKVRSQNIQRVDCYRREHPRDRAGDYCGRRDRAVLEDTEGQR